MIATGLVTGRTSRRLGNGNTLMLGTLAAIASLLILAFSLDLRWILHGPRAAWLC
jgi:hypothetical protein